MRTNEEILADTIKNLYRANLIFGKDFIMEQDSWDAAKLDNARFKLASKKIDLQEAIEEYANEPISIEDVEGYLRPSEEVLEEFRRRHKFDEIEPLHGVFDEK